MIKLFFSPFKRLLEIVILLYFILSLGCILYTAIDLNQKRMALQSLVSIENLFKLLESR
jgi:hypothetical protein